MSRITFVLDRLDIDGLVERAAHARILERIAALDVGTRQFLAHGVHVEEHGAQLGGRKHGGIRAGLDARHVLNRNRIDQVDVAREQSGNAGGIGADGLEHDLVEIVLHVPPPARIGAENRLHPWLVARDHEGAGAVGLEREGAQGIGGSRLCLGGAIGFRPCLRDDEPRLPLVVQDWVGRGEYEVDREIVDLFDLGIGWNAGLQLRAGSPRAFRREHHVVGREGRPVVESHPFAQMKAPPGRAQHLPALGEARHDLQVLVAPDQAFHHVGEQAERDRLIERVGVERVEAPLESHSGLRLALRCRAEHGIACQTGGKPSDEQKSKSQGSSCGHGWGALAMVCGTNGKLGKNW